MAKTEQDYFDDIAEGVESGKEKQYDENDLPLDEDLDTETNEDTSADTDEGSDTENTDETNEDTSADTDEGSDTENTDENNEDTSAESEKPLTLAEIKEMLNKEIEEKELKKSQEEKLKLEEEQKLKEEEESNKQFDENSVLTEEDKKVLEDLKELNPEVLDAFNVIDKKNKAFYEHQLKKQSERMIKEFKKDLAPLYQEFDRQQQQFVRTSILNAHPDVDNIIGDVVSWIEGQSEKIKKGYIESANGNIEERIAVIDAYKKANGITKQQVAKEESLSKQKQDLINKQKNDAKNKMKPVKSTSEGSKRNVDDLTEEELFDMYSK